MGEVKKQYHVMLAFASLIPSMKEMRYYGIDGKTTFTGVQSNEAGICQVQEMLHPNGLDRIILIVSEKANQPAEIKSEADRQKWQQFLDSKKKDAMSPVDFLKARISDKYEQLENIFIDIPYSENDSTRDSMNRIAEVAEHVQKVVDKVRETSENTGDVEIILHADMTGGFRYAAMMMLAIMQLSKYMGAKIGHVIYSELPPRERPNDPGRIRVIDDIHRMFDLIAGADEFQKYGSVQALEEYFGDTEKYGAAFQELFHAMRRFSDAIRICRTSVIEHEMSELAEKIRHFRDNKGSAIEEEMFAKIIGVIEKEYGSVIINADEPEADRRLDIIAWCVRKKFLQQAMTLCSEWIPGILVEKKICYTENLIVIEKCRENGRSGFRSWQQEFINSYGQNANDETPLPNTMPKGNYREISYKESMRLFREALNSGTMSRIKDLPPEMQQGIKPIIEAYEELLPKWNEQDLRICNVHTGNKLMDEILSIIPKGIKNPFYYQDILRRFSGQPEEDIFRVLGIDKTKCLEECEEGEKRHAEKQSLKKQESMAEKWAQRERCYRRMFSGKEEQVMYTDLPLEEAIDFLRDFFFIRQGRNDSNHAAENSNVQSPLKDHLGHTVSENEAIATAIAAYIKKLRAVKEA